MKEIEEFHSENRDQRICGLFVLQIKDKMAWRVGLGWGGHLTLQVRYHDSNGENEMWRRGIAIKK